MRRTTHPNGTGLTKQDLCLSVRTCGTSRPSESVYPSRKAGRKKQKKRKGFLPLESTAPEIELSLESGSPEPDTSADQTIDAHPAQKGTRKSVTPAAADHDEEEENSLGVAQPCHPASVKWGRITGMVTAFVIGLVLTLRQWETKHPLSTIMPPPPEAPPTPPRLPPSLPPSLPPPPDEPPLLPLPPFAPQSPLAPLAAQPFCAVRHHMTDLSALPLPKECWNVWSETRSRDVCERSYVSVSSTTFKRCGYHSWIPGNWSWPCKPSVETFVCDSFPTPPPAPPMTPHTACSAATELCVGLGCDWGRTKLTADGTLLPDDGRSSFPAGCRSTLCSCTPRLWPVSTCRVTIVPTRVDFLENLRSGMHGLGSRLNGMLAVAPYAISRGAGFQLSGQICALENRSLPHCFFQPVSNCSGGAVQHIVTDAGPAGEAGDGWDQRTYEHVVTHDASTACSRLGGAEADCAVPILAWRRIAQVVLRMQPDIEAAVNVQLEAMCDWSPGSYGAFHIRRTDKVQGPAKEADAVGICEYAGYMQQLAGDQAAGLDMFIATDDLGTVIKLAACPQAVALGWKLHHFSGDPSRGLDFASQIRLWADISMLVRASWVVGTFTSNIGRLVQLLRTQPPESFWSVDTPSGTWAWDQRGPM